MASSLPLAGSLQAGFGVCANEYAGADGRVVAVEYGCGAHSEVAPEPAAEELGEIYEDELVDLLRTATEDGEPAEQPVSSAVDQPSSRRAGTVDPVDDDQFAEAGEREQAADANRG